MDVLVSGYAHLAKRVYAIKSPIPDDVIQLIQTFYVYSLSRHEYVVVFLNMDTNKGHFAAFSLTNESSTWCRKKPSMQRIHCGKPGVCLEELGTTVKVFKLNKFPESIRNNLFPKYQDIPFSDKKDDGLHVMVRIEGENQMAPNLCTAYCLETDDLCVLPYSSTPIDRCGLLQSQKHGLLAIGGYDYESATAYKQVYVLKSRKYILSRLQSVGYGDYQCTPQSTRSPYVPMNISHGEYHTINSYGNPYGEYHGNGSNLESQSGSDDDFELINGSHSAQNGLIWVNNLVPDMHSTRSNQGVVMMEDENCIFVCGGWVSSQKGDTSTAELYSFGEDTVDGIGGHTVFGTNRQWNKLSAMNDEHLCHGTCYDPNNKAIFVLGGTRQHQAHLFEVFNFRKNQWFKLPNTLFPHKWFPSLKLVSPFMLVCCGNHYHWNDEQTGNGWGQSEFIDFREGKAGWHILDDQMYHVLGYSGVQYSDNKMRGIFEL